MNFDSLKLQDLRILQRLPSARSIRELARQFNIDPQNLTRRLKMIEESIGTKIINRSTLGINMSDSGREVVKKIDVALSAIDSLQEQSTKSQQRRLRVCGRGFMVDYFLYRYFKVVGESLPDCRFDFMDLSPELAERSARQGLLDILFSFNDIFPGENWLSFPVQKVDWKLAVRRGHPLTRKNCKQPLSKFPIVGFSHIESDRLISRASALDADAQLIRGDGAENSRYALKIVKSSDSLTFLPSISIEEELNTNEIEIIDVGEKFSRSETMHLHVNIDTIKAKEARKIKSIVTNKNVSQLN